ncbi:NAD(P)H-hydrate epimerase [Pararhodobacter aggregans]|uniref:NAD(P)H-hydrate epimerase n=1 Tax=Pararhodobacter aggregans TaxID=404875 RepID=UPI003A8F6DD1
MTDLVTSAQMRAIERTAFESGAATGSALMERAGAGVVEAILDRWPSMREGPQRALVLCGPGNNGGDGFVIARLLAARGWVVEVFLSGDPETLPPDASAARDRWRAVGEVSVLDDAGLTQAAARARREGIWVVVDALFGIGQRAPLDAQLAPVNRLIDALFEAGQGPAPFFVAVDVPSGRDADTGADLARRPLPADLIVTFHALKPLHRMVDTPVRVVDIGLPR